MSGAVIVPDLSVNQVAVKVLKQFAAENFAKSVPQCDGHSGLLNLQEQAGRDTSVHAQVSPPYSHHSQGTVERFRKPLMVRSEPSGLDLDIISDFIQIKWKVP